MESGKYCVIYGDIRCCKNCDRFDIHLVPNMETGNLEPLPCCDYMCEEYCENCD